VSIVASCERLAAIVPDLANRPRQLVFLTPIDSQLNDFLNEIHQSALLEPSIVERIDEDLDLYAKKKKLLRLADATKRNFPRTQGRAAVGASVCVGPPAFSTTVASFPLNPIQR
jgi:hypothetical protein